jgi:hypothetical protein
MSNLIAILERERSIRTSALVQRLSSVQQARQSVLSSSRVVAYPLPCNRDGLRPERMTRWSEAARDNAYKLRMPLNETEYPTETREYWRRLSTKKSIGSVF